MPGEMDAYKDIFLSESAEYIQSIVDGLIALENNPHDLEPVEVVFRGAHSLKGMAATMGYDRTSELTHKMESLMDTVRKREQPVDHSLIDLMLRAVDAAKGLIEAESSEGEPPDAAEITAAIVERTAAGVGREAGRVESAVEAAGIEASATGESVYRVRVRLDDECVLKSVRAYMVIKRLSHLGTVVETVPSAREIEDERFGRTFEVVLRTSAEPDEVVSSATAVSEVIGAEVLEKLEVVSQPEAGASTGRRDIPKLSETQTVRISIGHLDNMVNLVGELVILRSRLERLARQIGSRDVLEALGELHQVSGELQHEVMQTRMVPVGNIFNRFPRMVRDLARNLGKEVVFEMDGLDIELDRTVLDEIGDPIVHLLRNSIDHGIETPAERVATGKPEKGLVRLVASRERDQVRIVVSDDGRGLDEDGIWAKACEQTLVDPSQRDTYSAEDVLMLTCTPGFSTVAEVTKVSGRGVGMDVVKGKIGYLGGALYIRSTPGQGVEFVLTLPLTLAIIQALLVGSDEEVYAIQLGAVAEVLPPDSAPIETVDTRPVVVLRNGDVAPLYRLKEILGETGGEGSGRLSEEHVILVEVGGQVRALAVERLIGRQEIVMKPLADMFKHVRGLGGATVLGDGRVALILDPRTMFVMGE